MSNRSSHTFSAAFVGPRRIITRPRADPSFRPGSPCSDRATGVLAQPELHVQASCEALKRKKAAKRKGKKATRGRGKVGDVDILVGVPIPLIPEGGATRLDKESRKAMV